jgi:hypothetical protein
MGRQGLVLRASHYVAVERSPRLAVDASLRYRFVWDAAICGARPRGAADCAEAGTRSEAESGRQRPKALTRAFS